MGSGAWDTRTYHRTRTEERSRGSDGFDYAREARATGVYKTHKDLDPKGVKVRESRDSAEHPESRAVAVFFDYTGSMHQIPKMLIDKLPGLLAILLEKGYISDPQILFGAFGDAFCDSAPLQVGQFESDNRMEEHLKKILNCSGGDAPESYGLPLYFMDRHTVIDCWEKRGQKGYLFIIGDEVPHEEFIPKEHIKSLIGDNMETNPMIGDVIASLQERWEVIYLAVMHAESYTREFWSKYLGESYLELGNPSLVSETIATIIGVREGIALDSIKSDLASVGASRDVIDTVTKTIARVTPGTGITRATGASLPDVSSGKSGTHRL